MAERWKDSLRRPPITGGWDAEEMLRYAARLIIMSLEYGGTLSDERDARLAEGGWLIREARGTLASRCQRHGAPENPARLWAADNIIQALATIDDHYACAWHCRAAEAHLREFWKAGRDG